MTTAERPVLVYEEAAELRTERLWVCKRCGRAWSTTSGRSLPEGATGDDGFAERAARACCSEDRPCSQDGCANRVRATWPTRCADCNEKHETEVWEGRERRPWDGTTPLYSETLDRYFFDDSFVDYLDDYDPNVTELADLRLVICVPQNGPRGFSLSEYLEDCLPGPEHGDSDLPGDPAEARAVEKAVDDWVEKHAPFSWIEGKYAAEIASLTTPVAKGEARSAP